MCVWGVPQANRITADTVETGFYGLDTMLVEGVLRVLAGQPRAEGATRIDPAALGLDRGPRGQDYPPQDERSPSAGRAPPHRARRDHRRAGRGPPGPGVPAPASHGQESRAKDGQLPSQSSPARPSTWRLIRDSEPSPETPEQDVTLLNHRQTRENYTLVIYRLHPISAREILDLEQRTRPSTGGYLRAEGLRALDRFEDSNGCPAPTGAIGQPGSERGVVAQIWSDS